MFLTVLLYLDITALFIICICINVQFIRHDKTYLCCNYSQANQQCVADDMYASIVLSVKWIFYECPDVATFYILLFVFE